MANIQIRKSTRDLGYACSPRTLPTEPTLMSFGELGRIVVAMFICRADNRGKPFYEALFVGNRRITKVRQDVEVYTGDLADPLTWERQHTRAWATIDLEKLVFRLGHGESVLVQVEAVVA